MDQLDLHAASGDLARLIRDTTDASLEQPTPCEGWTVADLLQHIRGFAAAAAAAARRESFAADDLELTAELGPTWRQTLPVMVEQLAHAWQPAEAWSGMTSAGGIELPAQVAGKAALQELLLHGWDLARSTGQQLRPDGDDVATCLAFVSALSETERSQPFDELVAVPSDATEFDQLLGLAGRNPHHQSQRRNAIGY